MQLQKYKPLNLQVFCSSCWITSSWMFSLVAVLPSKILDYFGSEYEDCCLIRHSTTMYAAIYWLHEQPTASILKVEVSVLGLLNTEDEGNTFLQNVGNSFYQWTKVWHRSGLESSTTLLSDLTFYNFLLIIF
jgi:hypothetical protein